VVQSTQPTLPPAGGDTNTMRIFRFKKPTVLYNLAKERTEPKLIELRSHCFIVSYLYL